MFKRLSSLFGAKPAKKKKAAPRKAAETELREAADAMGEAAAAMKRAATEMNQAVTGVPQAAKAQPQTPPPATAAPTPPPAPASTAVDEAAAARVAAQTRAELIRQAMAVRRDKARVLNDLPARDQQRLRALAEKMMLGGTDAEAPPAPGTPPKRRH